MFGHRQFRLLLAVSFGLIAGACAQICTDCAAPDRATAKRLVEEECTFEIEREEQRI